MRKRKHIKPCPECGGTGLVNSEVRARYGDPPFPCTRCEMGIREAALQELSDIGQQQELIRLPAFLLSIGRPRIRSGRMHTGGYWASLPDAEVKDGMFLTGVSGYGPSSEAAAENLVHAIRGKTLVFGAYREDRHEVKVPITLIP